MPTRPPLTLDAASSVCVDPLKRSLAADAMVNVPLDVPPPTTSVSVWMSTLPTLSKVQSKTDEPAPAVFTTVPSLVNTPEPDTSFQNEAFRISKVAPGRLRNAEPARSALTPPEPLHTAVPKLSTVRPLMALPPEPPISSVAPVAMTVVPVPPWLPPVHPKRPSTVSTPAPVTAPADCLSSAPARIVLASVNVNVRSPSMAKVCVPVPPPTVRCSTVASWSSVTVYVPSSTMTAESVEAGTAPLLQFPGSLHEAPSPSPVQAFRFAGSVDDTVTMASSLTPSLVAVTEVDPTATPVTTPDPSTVATLASAVDHDTSRPLSTAPVESKSSAVYVTVLPSTTSALSGETSTESTGTADTTRAASPVTPSLVAKTVAEPAATPVTVPV